MPFCAQCGGPLVEIVPPDDDRPRLACSACGEIWYVNPKVVVGALPVVGGRALLLRRGIEPRLGTWTYPGGYLEMGESAEEGARREALEEIGVRLGHLSLLGVYSRAAAGIVVVVYVTDQVEGEPQLGFEALEWAYFHPEEIPWDDLAFSTTVSALRDWVRSAER